ncbi:MAG: tetratricopeptide repeat protein [Planctomycetes bacterium]|nr:tetratricopeptide repeat protein [Planctomycetota bacterium]
MAEFTSSGDYERKGFELLEEGRLEEAQSLFREALRLFPFSAELYSGLGQAYSEMGEYFLASRAFHQGLILSPGDEEMWFGCGLCLIQVNRLSQAQACFRRIEERLRNDPEALMQMALTYYDVDCLEETIQICRQVLAGQPEHAEALAMLGICLQETSQSPEEAHRNLRRAIELEPERWDWVEYYANILYEGGDRLNAFNYFDQIPLAAIRNQDSVQRLIQLLKKFRKDPDKVQSLKRRASEVARSNNFDLFLESLQEESAEEGGTR